MVKCGIFFAVRTEFLNIIYTRFGFKGLMRTRFIRHQCTLLYYYNTQLPNSFKSSINTKNLTRTYFRKKVNL
jgi:hypothetical protein